jgi:hypothetical protein
MKTQDYQPIADLYELIHSHNREPVYLLTEDRLMDREQSWWRHILLPSPHFPSFQVARQRKLSNQWLSSLNIHRYEIRYKTAELIPTERNVKDIDQKEYNPKPWVQEICQDITLTSKQQLLADFQAIQYVAGWITRHSSCEHQIHIASYRYLTLHDFIVAPDPCPYCLAFSLWFFHMASKHYGKGTSHVIHYYPFLFSVCESDSVYGTCEPLIYDNGMYFNADPDFAIWFYQRGLIISFLDLLRVAFELLRQLEIYRNNSGKIYPVSPKLNRESTDQFYAADTQGRRFYFYYENDHPLEEYVPKSINNVHAVCHRYQNYHAEHKRDANTICFKIIPEVGFSHQTFLSLHRQFKEYLTSLLQSYTWDPLPFLDRMTPLR